MSKRYLPGDCKVPKMAQSKALDEYASQVKFFEQAFDWSILSEMFYPYYWAKKCDWKALFQSQESSDLGFQAFLQSGMARVMVPVREGFEDAVVFYTDYDFKCRIPYSLKSISALYLLDLIVGDNKC